MARKIALIGLALVVVLAVAGVFVRFGGRLSDLASARSSSTQPPPPTPTSRALPVVAGGVDFSRGDHTLSIVAGGRSRDFILHVPPGLAASSEPGLVVVFHGAYDTAAHTEQITGLDAAADSGHYVVAYPQGYQESWNDLAGHSAAQAAHVDDVAFATALVSAVERMHPINHARVAAVGFSNGALLADLLGCQQSSVFHVIVPVEGPMPVNLGASCAPARPLSVLEVHGTADGTIPYSGGTFTGVSGSTTTMSAPAAVAQWAKLDGCSSAQNEQQLDAATKVARYQGCRDGVTVSLRTITGGTHAWPATGLAALVSEALASAR
jgi:polyhydroxybutyrate depolymerase